MSTTERAASRIVTDYWPKPIPLRCFDWSAYREDYDGAPDAGWPSNCIGHGHTKEEAIADLLEQEES